MNNFDLHNHSNYSDGLLSPNALMELAARGQCDAIALTDHDTTAGLDEAAAAAAQLKLRFIPGVEISVTWRPETLHTTLHIVGLNIDAAASGLAGGLLGVRTGRRLRAKEMAADLERVGITGALEGAHRFAENPDMIGRTHFARFLVEIGKVADLGSAFQRYLVEGKPGYVKHDWTTLEQGIGWIRGAGGIPVLAHPARYKIDATQMRELLSEFRMLGGEAIEVVTGSHSRDDTLKYARLAREFEFLASRGADFHGLSESQWQPGKLPDLPADLTPVWTRL